MHGKTTHLILLFLYVLLFACGGSVSNTSNSPPPPPPPPPPASVPPPQILWVGDAQVSFGIGDHGAGQFYGEGLVLIPDGTGGAMLFWEDTANGFIQAQRISSSGQKLWGENGIVVTNPVVAEQFAPRGVSDGAGGVILAWIDARRSFCSLGFLGSCQIFAQRIAPDGTLLWASGGIPITANSNNQVSITMISDGAGGAIVGWEDSFGGNCCKAFAQRIDVNGQRLWGNDGLRITPEPTLVIGGSPGPPQMVLAPNGTVIMAFTDSQTLASPSPVRVQCVSLAGQLLWVPAGVLVPGVSYWWNLTSDGSGGAFFTSTIPQSSDGYTDIFAQHIESNGQALWGPSGRTVASGAGAQFNPHLLPDGAGGFFVAWEDCPPPSRTCDIRAQRIGPTGQLQWGTNGVPVATGNTHQIAPDLRSDGSGGIVIVWNQCPDISNCFTEADIYVQRLDNLGRTLWPQSGVAVSTAARNQGIIYPVTPHFAFEPDHAGGFLLAWPDGRMSSPQCALLHFPSRCDLFAQRIR